MFTSEISDIIGRLRVLDVQLSGDGESIHVDAPDGVLTDALRLELTAHKPGILAFLKAADGGPGKGRCPLGPSLRKGALPLTFSQEALWFLDQSLPMRHIYNMGLALRLRGALDRVALQMALEHVVAKHEALRTAFLEGPNGPQQIIKPVSLFELTNVDLRAIPTAERETELCARATKFWRQTFDLSSGLLLRAALFCLDKNDHVLVLPMHHIVSDERSLDILGDEIGEAYQALAAGIKPYSAEGPIRYADFAVWQRENLRGEALDELVAYWRERLSDTAAVLDLPTDHPRPLVPSYRGAKERQDLTCELSATLRDIGRREGATLFMTFLAAFYVLLFRYTGQDDLTVGTPIAGRTQIKTESLIGYFVNMLVLRARVDGDSTFRDLLRQVREVSLGAFSHQDLPFEKLVEALHPQRDLSRNPFFQVTLDVRPDDQAEFKFGPLNVEPFEFDADGDGAKFDLAMSIVTIGGRLRVQIAYFTDLFGPKTIRRMMDHFVHLLEEIAANPDQVIGALSMLPEPERHQLLYEWNDTKIQFPNDKCVHELFEEQVLKSPDAVAAIFEHASLSYSELNRRANRLAHHLRQLGVKPDTRVAICVERGFEMMAGLLAVLKAGGTYLSLDPAYPAERLRFMLQDSAPVVLLTQSHLTELFADIIDDSLRVVDLSNSTAWQQEMETNPDSRGVDLTPEHLAYLIYTSGSSGIPKGVAIEHHSAVNFILWGRTAFSRSVLERTLFSTSLNFDLAVYELFVPITVGGTVVIVRDALELVCRPVDITLINTVPSAISALVDAGAIPKTVHTVNLAGEPLKRALVEKIFATTEVEMVCNLYGPSETTTYSTWVAMKRSEGFAAHIGRPVANTQVYILDALGESVPVGVVGELYIGGAGVARGYLNRPELTAERFLLNPFSDEPGARMYRTGDLGRHLADGNIEFLGRNDFQVKIRGFRIELGEIEARLTEHRAVREAVVIAREDTPGNKRLVAYYTATDEGEQTDALRLHLSATLPEYMVPAVYVRLNSLPLTPNGKLNRKALPAPEEDAYTAHKSEAPVGDIETQLAEIWAQVLGINRISAHDNFFDLGGHSLLLLQMRTIVLNKLGKDVPIIELFRHSTVRSLAGYLAKGDDDTSWDEGVERGRLQRSAIKRKFQTTLQKGNNQ
ncbi:MAG: amino acid adenylation domain-containing protein [Terracidiphilus sp.]|jgi:amino acid adenylation domain-containing protein